MSQKGIYQYPVSHTLNSLTSFFAEISSLSLRSRDTSTIVRFLPWLVNTNPTFLGEKEAEMELNGIGVIPRLLGVEILLLPLPLLGDDDEGEEPEAEEVGEG
jgi:hypothetical protein